MSTKPNILLQTTMPILLCLWFTGTSAYAGNAIEDISVEVQEHVHVVRIKTTSNPTFTVFRLNDPMRVVIDIAGGEFNQLHGPIIIENGVVGQIALRQFKSQEFTMGRVVVGFEKQIDYDVQTEPNAVVLRANTHAHINTVAPSADIEKPIIPVGVPAKATSEPLPTASQPASNTPKTPIIEPQSAKLLDISLLENNAQKTCILLKTSGDPSYTTKRLTSPARLVIDFSNTQKGELNQQYVFDHALLQRIRLGKQQQSLRTVFDLVDEQVESQLHKKPEGLLIELSTAASHTKAHELSNNANNTAEEPSASSVGLLHDVSFERGKHGSAKIILRVKGDVQAQIDNSSAKSWILKLQNVRLAKDQARSLDTKQLGTPVSLVSTYQADTDLAHVVAKINKTNAQSSLRREQNAWIWEIAHATANPDSLGFQFANVEEKIPTPEPVEQTAPVRNRRKTSTQTIAVTEHVPAARRRRISLDVKDADIINVLRLISEETGENIIASEDVKGKVTLKLRNVPAEQALDTILKTKGFDKVQQNNILRIAPAEAIQKERDLELAKKRSQAEVEETLIKMVTVNYATATEVLEQLKPLLSSRGSVQVDSRTNTLILQDILSNIDRLVDLTRRLDKQTPLVMIQARIVEAQTSYLRDLGVQWGGTAQANENNGNPTGLLFPGNVTASGGADDAARNQVAGISTPARYAVNLPATLGGAGGALGFVLGSAGGADFLNLRLSAMETNGTGKIISSPEVATLDNRTAKVSQGVEIPISVVSAAGTNTRFVPAVLELEVTPHVTNDGTVLLKIRTQKSEPDFSQKGAAGDPTIQKKYAETEVLVRDGDTSVIGGIYTRTTSDTRSEVPFFSKLPLLGYLFREHRNSDSRAELLVFITPRIINRQESMVVQGENIKTLGLELNNKPVK